MEEGGEEKEEEEEEEEEEREDQEAGRYFTFATVFLHARKYTHIQRTPILRQLYADFRAHTS